MEEFLSISINFDNYLTFKFFSGFIFLLDLITFLPYLKRDFGKEYQLNSFIDTKLKAIIFGAVWFVSSLSLMLPMNNWIAPLILCIIFRFFYIHSRPTNLFRGGGAVGMFPAFIATSIFISELMINFNFSWVSISTFLNFMLFHVGVVTLCAGIYKLSSGYLKGEGLEYALYNHMWSYWGFYFKNKKLPPRFLIVITDYFIALNQLIIGILMIFPETRDIGTIMLSFGFLILFLILKLGNLCLLVGVYSLLFIDYFKIYSMSFREYYFLNVLDLAAIEDSLTSVYIFLATSYISIKLLHYAQFYFRLSLPIPTFLRYLIEKISFYAPILIWRVFSADIINFYIKVEEESKNGNRYRLNPDNFYNRNASNFFAKIRFFHVAESCVLSSIFLSVRYDKKNFEEAKEKLLRYICTLDDQMIDNKNKLIFTYTKLLKKDGKIIYLDLESWIHVSGKIYRKVLNKQYSIYVNQSSFIRPLGKFGSYGKTN